MSVTDEQLTHMRQIALAATEGIELCLRCDGSIVECGVGGRYAPTEADIPLFEHAKCYVLELLAEVERLRTAIVTAHEIASDARAVEPKYRRVLTELLGATLEGA